MSNKFRTVGKKIREVIDAYQKIMASEDVTDIDKAERIASTSVEIAVELEEMPNLMNLLIIAQNLFIAEADERGEDLC